MDDYNLSTALTDSRWTGRAVRFRARGGRARVIEAATALWEVTATPAGEDVSIVASATLARGLHLMIFERQEYEQYTEYEVLLIREPEITQREAGRVWASVVSEIWRIVSWAPLPVRISA